MHGSSATKTSPASPVYPTACAFDSTSAQSKSRKMQVFSQAEQQAILDNFDLESESYYFINDLTDC